MRTSNSPPGSSRLTPLDKSFSFLRAEIEASQVAALGLNLLQEDVTFPAAVLSRRKLLQNLGWMKRFAATYDVHLAPHGKTTMAPKLFDMQLKAGAWGITLATAHQTRVAYEHGVRRVLMANQLVGKQNMAVIARLLEDPEFDFYCLVDSAQHVAQLSSFFKDSGKRLQTLVEIGVDGGRTGIRDDSQLEEVLSTISQSGSHIALSGLEVYEGILDTEAEVQALLHRTVATTRKLLSEGRFEREPVLLSGAGSAWYDVVAECFGAAGFGDRVEILLRPGCYLSHDAGAYRRAQQKIVERNAVAQQMDTCLTPALQIWAYVQSIPEKSKAIVALGKRDAAFDSGFPIPALHYRPGSPFPKPLPASWELIRMMDQHAYLRISEGSDLRIGDIIAFHISHPCLTFDRWRSLLLVDDDYRVLDVVQTFF